MSKAFVKEGEDDRAEALPDRPIALGPNPVTPEGLVHLDQMLAESDRGHADAVAANDANEIARTERDRRYWTARRGTAQVVARSGSTDVVEFGSSVTISRADGGRQTYRIVGADEADPAHGTLSNASPLARQLLGKSLGDEITMGGKQLEITGIG